jgi:DNA-binding PucR family transcriptional regulator
MQITEYEKYLIRTMCDNDLVMTKAAKELNYHRNSIEHQIKKLKTKTGYDLSTFYGAVALLRLIEEK